MPSFPITHPCQTDLNMYTLHLKSLAPRSAAFQPERPGESGDFPGFQPDPSVKGRRRSSGKHSKAAAATGSGAQWPGTFIPAKLKGRRL